RRIHWKSQRQCAAGSINLFVFFRQTDDWKVVQSQSLQFTAGCRELAFSSIDNDQVGQANIRLRLFFTCRASAPLASSRFGNRSGCPTTSNRFESVFLSKFSCVGIYGSRLHQDPGGPPPPHP